MLSQMDGLNLNQMDWKNIFFLSSSFTHSHFSISFSLGNSQAELVVSLKYLMSYRRVSLGRNKFEELIVKYAFDVLFVIIPIPIFGYLSCSAAREHFISRME